MTTMTTDPFVPQQRQPADDATAPTFKNVKIPNQHQMLEFEGRMIGSASTESSESKRWTVIEIYVTTGGNYVVHRIGASLVYHVASARCASGSTVKVAQLDYDDDHEPCDQCRPAALEALADTDMVRRETDRHSADAVETPEALVVALSLKRPNGSTYLSTVARDALADAATRDDRIANLTTKTVHIS